MDEYYCIMRDESDMFAIPVHMRKLFLELLEGESYSKFDKKFNKYRLVGDIDKYKFKGELLWIDE